MNLALFDFDGTITNKDTFTDFIYFAVDRKRLIIGKVLLASIIFGYKLGLLPPGKAREIVAGFGFKGRDINELRCLGRRYAEQMPPGISGRKRWKEFAGINRRGIASWWFRLRWISTCPSGAMNII